MSETVKEAENLAKKCQKKFHLLKKLVVAADQEKNNHKNQLFILHKKIL